MSNLLERLTYQDLGHIFDHAALVEAMQLFLDGQVDNVELDAHGCLSGEVSEGRRSYQVKIVARPEALEITCQCGRMHGKPCLHALALLTAWVDDATDQEEDGMDKALLSADTPAGRSSIARPPTFFPMATLDEIRSDWKKRLQNLTVKEMRALAAARRVKLKGTLREEVWQGLLQSLSDPAAHAALVERLAPDTRRVMNLLAVLVETTPGFYHKQILPFLDAVLNHGQAARAAETCLEELSAVGLYAPQDYLAGSHLPLQVPAYPQPDPTLFKPAGEPPRVDLAQPFQFTRLALRLLLMAQANQLRCSSTDVKKGRNAWPNRAGAVPKGEMIEVFPAESYLAADQQQSLATVVGLSAEQIDLAARLLENTGLWAAHNPHRLSGRAPEWMSQGAAEQARDLFRRAASFPSQVEIDLARRAGITPWRSVQRGLGYAEFLAELGLARLRLARLVALLPTGQWVQVESLLRSLHGLQPAWKLDFGLSYDTSYARKTLQNPAIELRLGSRATDSLSYDQWRSTYGQWHLFCLTHTLRWLGLVDVGRQGEEPVAVRLAAFGEFLVGRRDDFVPPPPPAARHALALRQGDALELDVDAAPLELVNLLLKIGLPEAGKAGGSSLSYRLSQSGLGKAFEDGWTMDEIVARLQAGLGAPLPSALTETIQALWQRFGSLQIYEDMTLIEFGDDYALPELLAGTSLSQILIATFNPRLVAVRSEKAEEYLAELQARGYFPAMQRGVHGE